MRLATINPGDVVRVTRPEYKKKAFTALSVYYDLVEIEIGNFVHRDYVQKKYRNKFITV